VVAVTVVVAVLVDVTVLAGIVVVVVRVVVAVVVSVTVVVVVTVTTGVTSRVLIIIWPTSRTLTGLSRTRLYCSRNTTSPPRSIVTSKNPLAATFP
jgi:hypothetical protein